MNTRRTIVKLISCLVAGLGIPVVANSEKATSNPYEAQVIDRFQKSIRDIPEGYRVGLMDGNIVFKNINNDPNDVIKIGIWAQTLAGGGKVHRYHII